MSYIPSSLLSSSIIKLNCYARSLRRPDKTTLENPQPGEHQPRKILRPRRLNISGVVLSASGGGQIPRFCTNQRLTEADCWRRSAKWAATTLRFLVKFNQP